MTEREEAEMIAARIVNGGLEVVPDIIHEEILLLARQFLYIEQRLHDCESQ